MSGICQSEADEKKDKLARQLDQQDDAVCCDRGVRVYTSTCVCRWRDSPTHSLSSSAKSDSLHEPLATSSCRRRFGEARGFGCAQHSRAAWCVQRVKKLEEEETKLDEELVCVTSLGVRVVPTVSPDRFWKPAWRT